MNFDNFGKNPSQCDCPVHQRGRKFANIIESLPIKSDQEWMKDFYNLVIETEEELASFKAACD